MAGAREPALPLGARKAVTDTRSAYFRIRDHAMFPSLKDTDLLFVTASIWKWSPPASTPDADSSSMFGPPEKVHVDRHRNRKARVVACRPRQGQVAYVLGTSVVCTIAEFTQSRRFGRGSDRLPAAGGAPVEIERPPAGRDHADEPAKAQPYDCTFREYVGPFRYGLFLSAAHARH